MTAVINPCRSSVRLGDDKAVARPALSVASGQERNSLLPRASSGPLTGLVPMDAPPQDSSAQPTERDRIIQWVKEIADPSTRGSALLELSKKRDVVPDLAIMLWNSFGTVAALLQEIICVYPYLNPPALTALQSNRVCNALALMQCVASHPETRPNLIAANIPMYLYPFLYTVSNNRAFEFLRLTSLGVLGALVKSAEPAVVSFLLSTEIIPLCLRVIEYGCDLSKTVATFILQRILFDETGLTYICDTYDRFSHVAMVLGKAVIAMVQEPNPRLLKHVIRCYLRMVNNPRALEALRHCLPDQLRDGTFAACLQEDRSTSHWLAQLLIRLDLVPPAGPVLVYQGAIPPPQQMPDM